LDLSQENLLEIFAALRFLENPDWLNQVFLKSYAALTPADFETRPIRLLALSDKWAPAAAPFIAHKWHNLSHLKELGVLFILPGASGLPGELLRTVSLLFHYLEEIPFYADLIADLARTEATFTENLISLLRGDVYDRRPPAAVNGLAWLVVQRYLAKDNPDDWRLSFPHLNTESILWSLARAKIARLDTHFNLPEHPFSFWLDSDWVGGFFPALNNQPTLISFDLVDSAMSLVKVKEGIRYTYHLREALWNQIFVSAFDFATLISSARRHLRRGFFTL